MPDDEQKPGEEPAIKAVSVSLADIVGDDEPELDELEDEELEEELDVEEAPEEDEPEEAEEEKSGGLDDLMDDIFADEQEEDDRLKAFGDLEHLTMVEVSSEVEAVLEELQIRQGGYE